MPALATGIRNGSAISAAIGSTVGQRRTSRRPRRRRQRRRGRARRTATDGRAAAAAARSPRSPTSTSTGVSATAPSVAAGGDTRPRRRARRRAATNAAAMIPTRSSARDQRPGAQHQLRAVVVGVEAVGEPGHPGADHEAVAEARGDDHGRAVGRHPARGELSRAGRAPRSARSRGRPRTAGPAEHVAAEQRQLIDVGVIVVGRRTTARCRCRRASSATPRSAGRAGRAARTRRRGEASRARSTAARRRRGPSGAAPRPRRARQPADVARQDHAAMPGQLRPAAAAQASRSVVMSKRRPLPHQEGEQRRFGVGEARGRSPRRHHAVRREADAAIERVGGAVAVVVDLVAALPRQQRQHDEHRARVGALNRDRRGRPVGPRASLEQIETGSPPGTRSRNGEWHDRLRRTGRPPTGRRLQR